MYTAIDFFAGSGLVGSGLAPEFETLWANDNCAKKREVYEANHARGKFHFGDVELVRGRDIPAADLAWASFPCQDLSLAGNLGGMNSGTRSGLFWEWVRVLKELDEQWEAAAPSRRRECCWIRSEQTKAGILSLPIARFVTWATASGRSRHRCQRTSCRRAALERS